MNPKTIILKFTNEEEANIFWDAVNSTLQAQPLTEEQTSIFDNVSEQTALQLCEAEPTNEKE